MPLPFWLDHFLDSRAAYIKFLRWCFGILKPPKSHSEINWPLGYHSFIIIGYNIWRNIFGGFTKIIPVLKKFGQNQGFKSPPLIKINLYHASPMEKFANEASRAALFQHTWTFDRFLNLISMDGQKQYQQCKHN